MNFELPESKLYMTPAVVLSITNKSIFPYQITEINTIPNQITA